MSESTNIPSASRLLAQAREAKELTLDQVSLQTRIPRDLIQALEEKNWSALPGAPYARAFCKTLAQAYEIDPDLVLEGLRNDMGGAPPAAKPAPKVASEIDIAPSKDDADSNRTPLLLAGILALALVLVIAATRLNFGGINSVQPAVDSLATDPESDSLEQDSLATTSLAPIPAAPPRKTATIKLADTGRSAFILYMRQGIMRIRKKNLLPSDTLEFDPDTAILVRNLSRQRLRISGAITHDSVDHTYFKVVRGNDSVRLESISESAWNEKAQPILDRRRKQNPE
ncbi:MAG TPA: helix-turn-helix transcriptional regulator [Fibrobacteria bacterium]|nr:helix-turn-helix transcriptional regulator [Fibrobacteria bacterium]